MDYSNKNSQYYSGIRKDWFNKLQQNQNYRMLEIGCGSGDNGDFAKKNQYCSYYCGVELSQDAADLAKSKVDEMLIGNVEEIDFPWEKESFDVLFMSEVLEHLVNPVDVLKRLSVYLKPGGQIFTSTPNVSHYSVLKMLIKGQWEYNSHGIMDETHLRWFTPESTEKILKNCGFKDITLGPVAGRGTKTKLINMMTFKAFDHLFWKQINTHGYKKD